MSHACCPSIVEPASFIAAYSWRPSRQTLIAQWYCRSFIKGFTCFEAINSTIGAEKS